MDAPSGEARLSPDGRWLAYISSSEIFVSPFPDLSGKWQISTAGAAQPRWRRDGKELFYMAPDSRLMAVPILSGAGFAYGRPQPLFETRITDVSVAFFQYDVAPDGRRFLINTRVEEDVKPITLVANWTAGLK